MMKLIWIYIVFAVVASSLTASVTSSSSSSSGTPETPRTASRMLKAGGGGLGMGSHGKGKVRLNDYAPVDPSPSSKAVRAGPIQHGTPLNPYIPRSPPPFPDPPMSGTAYP